MARIIPAPQQARVGNDPHVSFNWRNWEVYLPCQGSDVVIVLDAWDLDEVAVIDVPGAHGAITSLDARRFYTTNLPGLGEDAVIAIDTRRNRVKGVADAPHTARLFVFDCARVNALPFH